MDSQELYKKIVEISQAKNSTNVALGEYLVEMRKNYKFREVSGEGTTWGEFLASPEVKIPYSSAHRYIKIAEKYIYELGLTYDNLYGLDTWALYYCSKKVTKDNYRDWIEKIRHLSRNDLTQLVKFGDTDQVSCEHIYQPMPRKWKCLTCGDVTINNPDETRM
jgi:hypothetical protein